jgi:hypothetical protein
MAPDLDAWLPRPQVRTRHERSSDADGDSLWRAAAAVRVRDAPLFGWAVRWRIPGTSPDLPFRELLRQYPFTILDEGERHSISGLCGRIWTLARDYPSIAGPAEFQAWREPGTVRVAIAHWVEDAQNGGSVLISDARIEAIDSRASARLRVLWALVGRFDRFIGREPLATAVRIAERDESP